MTDAAGLQAGRSLAVRYSIWATVILAAAGLLGLLMRWSQAVPDARVGDNFWYAIMTAHGLGAFVGWAGFAVMGLSWWVLASLGLPPRGFGLKMARATFWLMVLGVLGVVITTVFMSFAASWVFLYPLPFAPVRDWGNWATGLFSFSVLLAGLSIVTWCFGILHTVLGPGLHAVSGNVLNRLGVAMGWGYLWPKRFATNPRSVPYPVIPLTVIGVDMIIATLPLAGLLVWQIFQSAGWVGDVDALFAKNILWWFGHPVVYLLLFPAVAIYYWLIPRYAGRELVAGNVVAIAWTVAVIANVLVWAHHIYLDYPEDSVQAQLNAVMQPMTFSLVLPSALSLYSLAFTIYRSRFRWTPASTALFLGLVGWLLSGLSGVVNATIVFDAIVHNTLWIVGHFHHMAFLNIGLLVFGATYALLPELTGNALYSERMAWVHVWGTFGLGTVVFGIWLIQGLDGAPRRFSVLPDDYDTLTRISLPFVLLLGLVQLLYFWNVWKTIRGKAGQAAFDERGIPQPVVRDRRGVGMAAAEGVLLLAVLAIAFAAAVAGFVIGRETAGGDGGDEPPPAVTTTPTQTETETGTTPTETTPTETTPSGGGDAAAGEAVFLDNCGACHTLTIAGTTGTVGPNLDETTLSEDEIVAIVTNGRGAMQSFADSLTEEEIADVAAYVAERPTR